MIVNIIEFFAFVGVFSALYFIGDYITSCLFEIKEAKRIEIRNKELSDRLKESMYSQMEQSKPNIEQLEETVEPFNYLEVEIEKKIKKFINDQKEQSEEIKGFRENLNRLYTAF